MNTTATSVAACLVLGLFGCAEQRNPERFGVLGEHGPERAGSGVLCHEPAQGCACAGNQPPVACGPDDGASLPARDGSGALLCYEGTRRCRDGVFGACEELRAFAAPSASSTALVDTVSDHPRCSDCEPNCYFVRDDLSTEDGALDDSFADGLIYHGSGAGITLEPSSAADPGVSDAGVPDGGLLIEVSEGLNASVSLEHVHHAAAADVYVLVDRSLSMSEEGQWLYDYAAGGATLGDSSRPCADDDPAAVNLGVTGAVRCMVRDPRFGAGIFRDVPYSPYASDQSLPAAARELDAQSELLYEHRVDFTRKPPVGPPLGGVESSGDPDFASSQIPALYSVATGKGSFTGIGRRSVPDAPNCASGAGYPCFAVDADRIVVLVTDSPMHNGPDSGSSLYDYNSADLVTLGGTSAGATTLPATNEDFASAAPLSSDAGSELAVFLGSTATLGPDVPAAVVACGADDGAADAVFQFDVVAPGAPGDTIDVTLSAEGTSFDSVLAVFDGPVLAEEELPSAGDENELFSSAAPLGEIAGRHIVIAGDTTRAGVAGTMQADYQASLYGESCGASSLAADAVYWFDSGGGSAPVPVELTLDMGGAHPVLAVYEEGAGPLPRWPAVDSPMLATGNTNALPSNVFTVPSGSGYSYVSVTGDTRTLDSDYAALDVGVGQCFPADDSRDAAFLIHVEGTQHLRLDTEGSEFDTVLSLHDRPPLTKSGAVLQFDAASTHQNSNESAASAYATGMVNGLTQVFAGDTEAMSADVTDSASCGVEPGCGDAVYRIEVVERTTLRVEAAGTGFEPAVVVTRADPAGVSGRYGAVATGGAHSCALSGGEIHCFGADDSGQLGDGGTAAGSSAPVTVSGLNDVIQVCAGISHSCAVTQNGQVHCWGKHDNGRLGSDPGSDALAPVQVDGFGPSTTFGPAVQAACGDRFSCVLLQDGGVACFGDNTDGQLGDGTTSARSSPALVTTAERFEQLDAGTRHVCAVRATDGAIFCWGDSSYGQLGNGVVGTGLLPARAGTITATVAVTAGDDHSCAVHSSGRVSCWGRNDAGQLGQGAADTGSHPSPLTVLAPGGSVPLANVAGSVNAGRKHTCVTQLSGFAQCWGDNSERQLGHDRTVSAEALPVVVADVLDAVQVFSGYNHSCLLRQSGALVCFGRNADGQLGDGTTAMPSRPVATQPGTGGDPVAFGNGTLDQAFTTACHSIAQAPEAGCRFATSSGRAYSICDDRARTWSGAGLACEAVGMQLANIDTNGENVFLASVMAPTARAWIGAKRESSADWLELAPGYELENLLGERIWYTEATLRCTSWWFGTCTAWEDHMIGDFTAAAAPDLVGSSPQWSSSSTMTSRLHPNVGFGRHCMALNGSTKWISRNCTALTSASDDPLAGIPWVSSQAQLVLDSLGGRFNAPLFSGGVEHGYLCEERDHATEVTLDPGQYYVTVKGIADGVTGNACEGPYELKLTDLGTPGGGFLTCDDDGIAQSTSSVLDVTLTEGNYYLILKGKAAGDEGNYRLTVRDADAVTSSELACDAGSGTGDPARIRFDAEPGRRYYALVKGEAPLDQGAFTLSVRDAGPGRGASLGCDASGGPTGDPELRLPLQTGSYYAVLKGRSASAAGGYSLTLGGAAPVSSSFEPPSYDATVDALRAEDIRVATVLSCEGRADCDDTRAQATVLAADTSGLVRDAPSAADVPLEVVRAIEQLERADRIGAEVVFEPDANPGFTLVTTLPVPAADNHCASFDAAGFGDCLPGATPAFLVSLHNPALAPVPVGPPPLDGYSFTLRLTSERNGEVIAIDDVPLLVRSAGRPPPGTYDRGQYVQDIDARGCAYGGSENLRPSWDELRFDADVRPDTSVSFSACTADSAADLDACDSATFDRVLTITAATGEGVPCTVATQTEDCPDGYCSPYTGICNYLEGASCIDDTQCPGEAAGSCRTGPSAALLGDSCRVLDHVASPASALDGNNLRSFLRMQLDLRSLGDGSRTPSVFFWDASYRCRMTE